MTLPTSYALLAAGDAPKHVRIAASCYGLTEIVGPKHNEKIVKMAKALGKKAGIEVNDDETPWCAIFVSFCLLEAGFEPPSIAVRATSYLKWGVAQDIAMLGDILVFSAPTHTGFYVGHDATHYYVLGGNQGNQVSIIRISRSRCIGIRRPPYTKAPSTVRPVQRLPTGVPANLSER